MENSPELLKSFANRLADTALSGGALELTRLLKITGLLNQGPRETAAALGDQGAAGLRKPANSDLVGIWQRTDEGGKDCFVRRADMQNDWYKWANVARIEPKKARWRVVFIGESAARGFLYDPHFNPAKVLEKILQAQLGASAVEVIDLARIDISYEIADLILSAVALQPDAVIVFAGNNWGMDSPVSSAADVPYFDSVLRAQGVSGWKSHVERKLAVNAGRIVRESAAHYAAHNIPVTWIVPEFNLGDWRDPLPNAPYLKSGGNEEWIEYSDSAKNALQSGKWQTALAHAGKMVALDQGVCCAGQYILAQCHEQLGDLARARHHLELARDAPIWDHSVSVAPRTFTATASAIVSESRAYGNEVVSLPEVFAEHLDGGIPGRSLFLDYCHLTTEGIQVAMAAASASVLKVLKNLDIPWRKLLDKSIAPSPAVEAEAAFLAAVHNGHWGQSYDLVHYHCARAIKLAPEIVQVMTQYIDVQTRRAPLLMCKSAEVISGSKSPLIPRYLLQYNKKQLDTVLLDAMADSLMKAGHKSRGQLDELRRLEHSVVRRDVDLLDYYYGAAAAQNQEWQWASRPQLWDNRYYKAFGRESEFVFIGEAGHAVCLRLACRLPEGKLTEGAIALTVNGKPFGGKTVNRAWINWELAVPGDTVLNGVNRIIVHWPMPLFPGDEVFDTIADTRLAGGRTTAYCVFGEIHAFTASNGTV